VRGRPKVRLTLPAIVARPTPKCEACERGYAIIRADFEELYPVLRAPGRDRRWYEKLHGHGLSTPELIFDSTHCAACHALGTRVIPAWVTR
jgi:hypothetical protein